MKLGARWLVPSPRISWDSGGLEGLLCSLLRWSGVSGTSTEEVKDLRKQRNAFCDQRKGSGSE